MLLTISIKPEDLKLIDEARGIAPRGAYLVSLIGGVPPAPKAPPIQKTVKKEVVISNDPNPFIEKALEEKPRFTTHPTPGYHLVSALGKYMVDN